MKKKPVFALWLAYFKQMWLLFVCARGFGNIFKYLSANKCMHSIRILQSIWNRSWSQVPFQGCFRPMWNVSPRLLCMSEKTGFLLFSQIQEKELVRTKLIAIRKGLHEELYMYFIGLNMKRLQFSEAFHLLEFEFGVFLFLGRRTRELCWWITHGSDSIDNISADTPHFPVLHNSWLLAPH